MKIQQKYLQTNVKNSSRKLKQPFIQETGNRQKEKKQTKTNTPTKPESPATNWQEFRKNKENVHEEIVTEIIKENFLELKLMNFQIEKAYQLLR